MATGSFPQAANLPPAFQNRNVLAGIGGVILLLIIGAVAFFFINASKNLGSFEPLLQNIDQVRALEISAVLQNAGIETELVPGETGGVTINVRQKQKDLAVLNLAGNEILIEDDFKLFDKSDWSASDFERRVKYTRAVSGELSRLITRMDGIRSAKAHVSLPEKRLFDPKRNVAATSANVQVEMHAGGRLSPSQVAAIMGMVKGYVPEISEDKITISDTAGNIYVAASGDTMGRSSGSSSMSSSSLFAASQLSVTNNQIQGRVQRYLDALLGGGQADVAVSIDFDSQAIRKKSTTFRPGAIGTHSYSEEALGQAALKDTPRFGASGPIPPAGQANTVYACAHNDSTCRRNYRQHNYNIQSYPSYEEVISESPSGRITGMSISVAINRASMPGNVDDFKRAIAAAAHPSASVDNVQILPRAGSNLKKNSVKIEPSLQSRAMGYARKSNIPPWLLMLLGIILLIVALFVLLSVLGAMFSAARSITQRPNIPPLNLDRVTDPSPPPDTDPPPATADEIPFDLDDEFQAEPPSPEEAAGTENLESREPGTSLIDDFGDNEFPGQASQTGPRRPQIIIDDE